MPYFFLNIKMSDTALGKNLTLGKQGPSTADQKQWQLKSQSANQSLSRVLFADRVHTYIIVTMLLNISTKGLITEIHHGLSRPKSVIRRIFKILQFVQFKSLIRTLFLIQFRRSAKLFTPYPLIIPCSTNMVRVRVFFFFQVRFYFILISSVLGAFLIKQVFHSRLLDMKCWQPTRRSVLRWLSIISYSECARGIN